MKNSSTALAVVLLVVGLVVGTGIGFLLHSPAPVSTITKTSISTSISTTTVTKTVPQNVTSPSIIGTISSSKNEVMTSPTGMTENVTFITYRNSTSTWYQYTFHNYGSCLLPVWSTVTYYPFNAPNATSSHDWDVYAFTQNHESYLNTSFPAESWSFQQMNALPLNAPFPAYQVLGNKSSAVTLTQMVGDAVGVSYYGGIVYVPADSNTLYAINAYNGHLVWMATTANSVMSNPLVVGTSKGPLVISSVGDAGFSASHGIFAVLTGNLANVIRGYSYGAVYAFNGTTGSLIWVHFDSGNVMPTPAVVDGLVVYGDGSGHIVALNLSSGKVVWRTYVGASAFDSMSSTNYYIFPNGTAIAVMGFTLAKAPFGEMVAVNVNNGHLVWNFSLPSGYTPFNTGMGDVSPAVDQSNGILVQSTIVNFVKENKTIGFGVFALNVTNGHLLWIEQIGRGYVPPAFKGGVPTIVDGVVYVGSPVTNSLFALNESNGKIVWEAQIPNVQGPPQGAGGGRANPVVVNGYVIEPAGGYVNVYNATNGMLIKNYYVGGRFGIVNAVVVGNTVFLDNSYSWAFAIPLSNIL